MGTDGMIEVDESFLKLIPPRRNDANKGDYKRVLIAAGSGGMAGAAYFAALAAYRTGAGLVYILTPEENRQILQILLPEAVICTYTEREAESFACEWEARIVSILGKTGAAVLGPGIGTSNAAENLTRLLLEKCKAPMVLDADALNIISGNEDYRRYLGPGIIVTPHPGEAARLTGRTIEEILRSPGDTAEALRGELNVTCVLKTHRSVTAALDGHMYVNTTGTPALAKGGSGDVLTGIIAGLICLGFDNGYAAALGCCIHGLAGRIAASRYGEHGVLARETADAVCEVMKG